MARLPTRPIALWLVLAWLCSPVFADPAAFTPPQPVTLDGYEGHAMEPFVSRDGRWLFFNSRNQPQDQTDLHLAQRVSVDRFRYLGRLDGANSQALDGVPSLDREGRFYFVSTRAYDETRNTLFQGRFEDGTLTEVTQVAGDAPRRKALWLNIDQEISADGQTLYFAENRWRLLRGGIASSNLAVAYRDATGAFLRARNREDPFALINTDALEFAPATTEDELTLYFTRADPRALRRGESDGFGIFVATRPDKSAPFAAPQRIDALTGYVEAPSVAPDGCTIYIHKRVEMQFRLFVTRRVDCP
ncbi:MAG: hypothetical protein AAFR93_06320 [Pseudomonadota bacterium]